MPDHDIIVIGTSAGGLKVLIEMVRSLPPAFPAAVFVVCHISPLSVGALPEILSRSGQLLALSPRDGEPIYPGHIYVAPPDWHMVLEPGVVRLSHGPRENLQRPAIDPLFRSAAKAYGAHVIGVILSGALSDGVAGLLAIRTAGGKAIIQDPKDAEVPGLPRRAHAIAGADHVVTAAELAPLLTELVRPQVAAQETGTMAEVDPLDKLSQKMAVDLQSQARDARRGSLATFTCPECGGAMWQVDQQELVRFSCHVGHNYYAQDLLDQQSIILENALWTAIRLFKEKTILARQLVEQQRLSGRPGDAEHYAEEARISEQYGAILQEFVTKNRQSDSPLPGGEQSPSAQQGRAKFSDPAG